MLNHSLSQLRQVKLTNLGLPPRRVVRSTSGASVTFSADVQYSPRSHQESPDRHHTRPPALRRSRSSRGNPLQEAPVTRFQRLETAIESHAVESFFVLYDENEVAYISEEMTGTDSSCLPFALDSRSRKVEMVVFLHQVGSGWKRLPRLKIHLNNLASQKMEGNVTAQNVIYLQFEEETWYRIPLEDEVLESTYIAPRIDSYSVNQALRLQNSTEYINDALKSMSDLKKDISARLEEADERIKRAQDLSILETQLTDNAARISTLQRKNKTDSQKVAELRHTLALRRALLTSSRQHMSSVRQDLHEAQEQLRLERGPSSKIVASEIQRVQRELTMTLSVIYPIVTTPTVARIRGLATARNSDYWQQNNEEAAALGYIAHFVFLLSHFLSIPLRYPVRPISSHSFILDPISRLPTSSDITNGPPYSIKGDRQYPLFYERGSVERLQWGVFLLNKNIEQLLQARGLVCGDLRDSLQNLESLVLWLGSVNEEDTTRNDVEQQPNIPVNGTHIVEITDHEDLLAAQLRSRIEGKKRMSRVDEKEID